MKFTSYLICVFDYFISNRGAEMFFIYFCSVIMLSIGKGVVSIFVTKVLVALLGLATVILTSQWLGAEGRGVVSLFVTSVAFLQLFCDYGCSSVIINLSYHRNQYRLWQSALVWVMMICTLSYVFVLFFKEIPYVMLVPVGAFLLSAVNVHNHLLMGNRQVNKRNIILVVQPLLLLGLFAGLYFWGNKDVSAYPMAFIAGSLISSVLSYGSIAKMLKASKKAFQFEEEILRQGFWVQSGHAIQFLNYRINFFLIVFLIDDAALGIYNNAIVLAEALWILGHSMGQMLHMKILNTKDVVEQRRLTMKLLFYNLGGTVLMLVVLLLIPAEFWAYLFSKDFGQIKELLLWLAPGVVFFSISNIINHYFHAKNQFKWIVWCNICGLVAGTIACYLLIGEYGITGACMAWSAALGVAMLAYLILYFKRKV